jgi:hypothetical protein
MRQLLRMIDSRRSGPEGDATLIDVVGGSFGEHERLLPPVELRGERVLRSSKDIYYLWLNEAGGYLTVIDRRNRRGLVWFTVPERIASWHIARPFLHVIKGLSLQSQWTPIHAAAVALGGAGILIVGNSGAGKTSLAVGCALAGWDYLGDDAVIVRADPPTVGALYSSARLRADTFDLFPKAMTASLEKMKGSTTGKVEMKTSKKTASAPSQSSASRRARAGGSGICAKSLRNLASSSVESFSARSGGALSAITARTSASLRARRTAMKARWLAARSDRQPIKYMIPSIKPQARLQPMAPISMVRTSASPDSAALSEPVKVRTMINPNRTSETRSIGERMRFGDSCSTVFM